MTDQTPATVSYPVHEPHCNDQCVHYLEGSGSVRSDAGRVQERVPGVVRSQHVRAVPTDPCAAAVADSFARVAAAVRALEYGRISGLAAYEQCRAAVLAILDPEAS